MCRFSGNGIENGTRLGIFPPPERGALSCFRKRATASRCGILPRLATRFSASERVDARREPRQLARDRVFVENALGSRPMQLGLRQLKCSVRRLLVPGRNRRLDFFDESTYPAGSGPIDRRPFGGLTNTLFCRFMSGHGGSPREPRAGLYGCHALCVNSDAPPSPRARKPKDELPWATDGEKFILLIVRELIAGEEAPSGGGACASWITAGAECCVCWRLAPRSDRCSKGL
jgi:hypothetical protein